MSFNSGLLVSVLIISAIFISISAIIFYTSAIYDVQTDAKYQYMFDKYSSAIDMTNNTRTIIQGGDIKASSTTELAYPSTIASAKQLISAGDLFNSMVSEVPNIFSIPSVFLTAFFAIISLFSILGFIAFLSLGRTP